MSFSAWPRAYFTGHFYWNPSTYNNDDYGGSTYNPPLIPYDPAQGRPRWCTFLAKQHPPVTRSNFLHWSQQLYSLGPDSQGNEQTLPPPEWNFFGGNQCGFVTDEQPVLEQPWRFSKPSGPENVTLLRGWTDSDGTYSDEGDPWLGLELRFNAAAHLGPFAASPKLIDINPQSPFTSQVFVDDFRLGDADAGFGGPVSQRMHSRWLFFSRNLNQDSGLMIAGIASTVFQTGLRFEDIAWTGGSALQDQLRAAAGAKDAMGVLLQFVAYDTLYFNGPYFGKQGADQFPGMVKIRDLYVEYYEALDRFWKGESTKAPKPPCDRAYSRVVGWIGPWMDGSYVTYPNGRLLLGSVGVGQPSGLPQPVNIPVAQGGEPVALGPAAVEILGDTASDTVERLSVNLISTIPEWDSSGARAEVGLVALGVLLPGDARPTHVADLVDVSDGSAYRALYEKLAGIVDVNGEDLPFTLSQLRSHPLVIMVGGGSDPAIGLTESPLNAQTNTRGVYADEPTTASGPTDFFEIEVKAFDAPPGEQIGLVVTRTDPNGALTDDDDVVETFYETPSGDLLKIDAKTIVDATSGSVKIGVRGASPGMPLLVFHPIAHEFVSGTGLSPTNPVPLPSSIEIPSSVDDFTSACYAAVRVLPFHNADADAFELWLKTSNPDVEDVNHRVFCQVYETFHLMYPVMDFIGTPQKFQQWRGRILQVTDPANLSSSAYMPPTRSLSAGERRILELYSTYLDGVHAEGSPLRKPRPVGGPTK